MLIFFFFQTRIERMNVEHEVNLLIEEIKRLGEKGIPYRLMLNTGNC